MKLRPEEGELARILGQLRCGRCSRRFWPERGACATLVITCPHCSAAHANPGALPWLYFGVRADVEEWARRYWIDALPRGAWQGVWRFHSGIHAGFAWCIADCRHQDKYNAYYWTFALIAAHGIQPEAIAGWPASAMRGGIYWVANRYQAGVIGASKPQKSPAQIHTDIVATIEALRGQIEPLLAADEVPDPVPLDRAEDERELLVADDASADEHIESQRVRCSDCGAPSTLAALVGREARCPFCAVPQKLTPEVAAELFRYQRRVHAARLRGKTLFVTGMFASPMVRATIRGSVMLVCTHCGAPNEHRHGMLDEQCTSCRAALVPSKKAMVRAVAQEMTKAGRSHGRQAVAHVLRERSEKRRQRQSALAVFGVIGLLFLSRFVWGFLGAYDSWVDRAWALVVASIIAAVLAGAGFVLWRWMKKWQAERREAWLVDVTPLAEQLGAVLGDPELLIAWAQRWWTDHIKSDWLDQNDTQCTLTFEAGGFPAAISMDAHGQVFLGMRPHLVLLLAAELPRDVIYWVRTPVAREIADDFEGAGLHLELRTGGLALWANHHLLDRLRSEPERVTVLALVVSSLVRLAHILRAQAPVASG